MIVELRQKAQITIPKDIVKKMNIKEGDQLDISEKDGKIQIVPVVLCPADYIQNLKKEIQAIKSKVAEGQSPEFDYVDNLFEAIEKEKEGR